MNVPENMSNTLSSKLLETLALAALLALFAYAADEAEKTPEPDPSATPCFFFVFIRKTDLKKRNCRLYWN